MKSPYYSIPAFILGIFLPLLPISSQALAADVHPVTGDKLAEEQTFIYRALDESPTLDPQLIEDVEGSNIARDIFEGLLTQNADGTLAPGVATRWEVNDKKNVYTFYLRKNARWSNGDPVTAHDFVYAWRRLPDPEVASKYASYMALMSVVNASEIIRGEKPADQLGVKALDDYTFQVTLDSSLPYFPAMVVHTSTMPVPAKLVEKLGNNWTRPENIVGNGAFKLKEHIINERLVRVRNPLYWNNDKTILDKVVMLIIVDENQAYNRYQANEVYKTEIPAGQYRRLIKQLPDETHAPPRLCSYYYIFNTKRSPFDDTRVRKALSYAINRDIITRNVIGAGQFPAYTLTPEATANFTIPKIDFATLTQKERNKQAKQLLSEAGFNQSNPLKVEILYNTQESHKKIAIAISQMWKQTLGVKTSLVNQEWKTYLTTRHAGNFDVARAAWCGDYNEASTFLDLVKSNSDQNDGKYNNPEVDRLLVESKTLPDPNPNYTKIEKIITTEFPLAPIYHYTTNIMLKPFVKGWPLQNVEQNWYSKDMYITAH